MRSDMKLHYNALAYCYSNPGVSLAILSYILLCFIRQLHPRGLQSVLFECILNQKAKKLFQALR